MKGEDVYNLALTRIGCSYKLGAIVPKNKSDYNSAFDCAELASWLVFQCYNFLYGCDTSDIKKAKTADAYTGFWNRDAKAKGIIIPVSRALRIKGAFLLRIGGDDLIGHIVVSDGNAGTVEAHSTKKGVGKFGTSGRRFDIGVLLPGVDYCENLAPVVSAKPSGIVYRFTNPLMPKSDAVKRIQQALRDKGFKNVVADGLFGKGTMNAVYDFQKNRGLTPDGEVYNETAKALNITL